MQKLKFDKEPIMEQLKAIAHAYKVNILANELNKPYSTLANELNETEWAKMGFRDALTIIELAQASDARPVARQLSHEILDMLADKFGRVMFTVPPMADDMTSEMQQIASLSKTYGKLIENMAHAMSDGRWDKDEIDTVLKLSQDLLKAALPIYNYILQLKDRDGGNGGRR